MATPHPVVMRTISHLDFDIEVVKGEMKRLMRQRGVIMVLNQHLFTEPRVYTIWRKDTERLIAWIAFLRTVTPNGKSILEAKEIVHDRSISESELTVYLSEFMKDVGIRSRTLKQRGLSFFHGVRECRIQTNGLSEGILDALPPLPLTRKADTWIITL